MDEEKDTANIQVLLLFLSNFHVLKHSSDNDNSTDGSLPPGAKGEGLHWGICIAM
jgi:hypothetical protein